jgi:TPP-dependent pyruvate/acetoin dehydrogenase alpha subunit
MRDIERKIRDFEIRLQQNMKHVFCPVHLSLGQEKVAGDMHEVMKPADWLFSTHRNHHHFIAKGGDEQKLWDEIMGLETGLNGGFAGSQAIVDTNINFHSSAIVGGLVGVAAGTAYSLKINQNLNDIVICCIGDAGTEQGVFWETLNFSALHKLPIAFICENNGKSVDALIEERQATPLVPRVESFGVNCLTTVIDALNYCRLKRMPVFCEVKVTLECAHLNMATMLDLCDQSAPE